MAKPSRFPMPVWLVMDVPALRTASGPVYRATIGLAVAYWMSGCVPLPDDDVTMASLVRLPHPHIRPIKIAVLHALEQILPQLDREWRRYEHNRSKKSQSLVLACAAKTRRRAGLAQSAHASVPFVALPTRQDVAPMSVVIAGSGEVKARPSPNARNGNTAPPTDKNAAKFTD